MSSLVPPPDVHLTTGWEPDCPPDDTLVRRAVLVHASWPVEIAHCAGRPWRRTDRWSGAVVGRRGDLTNPVVLLQPLHDPDPVLAEIEALFPRETPYLLISAWPTPDLRGHGLALLGHPPVMVRFPRPRPADAIPWLDVREVADPDTLAVAERVIVEGYPMPELEPVGRGDLLDPSLLGGRTRVWLAWDGDTPVGAAAAHQDADMTLVEYVAVLPQARGRGVGAAVTWAATLADPTKPAALIASDDGRPVYSRMGYLAIERWTAWLRPGREAERS